MIPTVPKAQSSASLLSTISFLLACLFSASVIAADSWPQQEDGASAAGFSQAGIDQLDAAMQ